MIKLSHIRLPRIKDVASLENETLMRFHYAEEHDIFILKFY